MSEERLPLSHNRHRFWFQLYLRPTSHILGPHFPGQDCGLYNSCHALDIQMNSEKESSSTITKDSAKGYCGIRNNPVRVFLPPPSNLVFTENFRVGKGPCQLVHKHPRLYDDCPGDLSH